MLIDDTHIRWRRDSGIMSLLDTHVTERSDMRYAGSSYRGEFSFTTDEFLNMAPCPPGWNKSLFWNETSKTNLTQEEIGAIVVRCEIPSDASHDMPSIVSHGSRMEARVSCNTTCVVLCGVLGGMLLFLMTPVALIWWSKKRVKKAKFDGVCRVNTVSQNHDSGVVIRNGHLQEHYSYIPENHFYEEIGQPNSLTHPETSCFEESKDIIESVPEVPLKSEDHIPPISNISHRLQPNFDNSHGCKNPVYKDNDSNYYKPPLVEDITESGDNDHQYEKRHNRVRGKLNRAFAVEEIAILTDSEAAPPYNISEKI